MQCSFLCHSLIFSREGISNANFHHLGGVQENKQVIAPTHRCVIGWGYFHRSLLLGIYAVRSLSSPVSAVDIIKPLGIFTPNKTMIKQLEGEKLAKLSLGAI